MACSEVEYEVIKFKGILSRILFPRDPSLLDTGKNTWGITLWKITEIIEGNFTDFWGDIKIVGSFYKTPELDTEYTILAREEYNEQYGKQWKLISFVEEIDFSKISNQKAFLKKVLTSNQIENFYAKHENPLELIVNKDTEKILAVKGIGEKLVESIYKKFDAYKNQATLFIELEQYELSSIFLEKLIERYNDIPLIIDKIKNHPYDLVMEVKGVGFKTADTIALKSGMLPTAPERIMGYVSYLLDSKAQEGNSYLYAQEVMENIYLEFGGKENILELYYDDEGNVIDNNINKALTTLENKNIITKEDNEDKRVRRIYLNKYYRLEKQIAMHLKRLLDSKNYFEYNKWEQRIQQQEEQQGWTFTEEQKAGIKMGLDEQVCFITGLGGTGKSSLVAGILSVLDTYEFAQCSLSGKAAARLKEVTGKDGYTIHRLLGYNPCDGFTYNLSNPLPYNIIIVDEISLIGGEIFLKLLEAIPNGCKLIVLGDMGQLESIGCMNLASDLYYSPIIPKSELTIIHRQAQKSGIITSSHAVRRGEQLFDNEFDGEIVIGELEDMIINITSKDLIMDKVLDYFNYYFDKVNHNIMKIQLISPIKERGENSVFKLNRAIQSEINPKIVDNLSIPISTDEDRYCELRAGDKVLCTKNLYGIYTSNNEETDIFNGWTGLVQKIELIDKHKIAYIYFPLAQEEVVLGEKEVRNYITLGYAITAHKMQGASAEIIIGVLDYSTPPMMLTKELLYTIITRAEKMGIVVGQGRAIRKAIDSSGILNKKTFLQELLLLPSI